MSDKNLSVEILAGAIETEMRRLGLWNDNLKVLDGSLHAAFGCEHLSFEEWLQGVFLPTFRRAGTIRTFPAATDLATAALRNFDGIEGVEQLLRLFAQVDKEIE